MIEEFLRGFGILIIYFIIAALTALAMRKWLKPPKEVFRKTLHIICVCSIFIYLYAFETFYVAAAVAMVFGLIVYPLLKFAERYPKLLRKLSERKSGEFKNSLLIVEVMFTLLILVFWGLLGDSGKPIIMASVMAWGFGDAAAALVGKAKGKRYVNHKWVDQGKTFEGSLAMSIVSFFAIFITFLCYAPHAWYISLLIGVITAPICAVVELISSGGMDTITVPISTSVVIYVLMCLLKGLGV